MAVAVYAFPLGVGSAWLKQLGSMLKFHFSSVSSQILILLTFVPFLYVGHSLYGIGWGCVTFNPQTVVGWAELAAVLAGYLGALAVARYVASASNALPRWPLK